MPTQSMFICSTTLEALKIFRKWRNCWYFLIKFLLQWIVLSIYNHTGGFPCLSSRSRRQEIKQIRHALWHLISEFICSDAEDTIGCGSKSHHTAIGGRRFVYDLRNQLGSQQWSTFPFLLKENFLRGKDKGCIRNSTTDSSHFQIDVSILGTTSFGWKRSWARSAPSILLYSCFNDSSSFDDC